MFSCFSENVYEKIGGSVDDLRVSGKFGFSINEAAEAYDFFNRTQVPHFCFDDGKTCQDGELRSLLGFLDTAFSGDFSFEGSFSCNGQPTRNMEEVSATDTV